MQQLSRAMGSVDALVNHGLSELQGGTSPAHVLREVALMGALVGAGMTASRAIRSIESAEARLVGGAERAETGYHTGAGMGMGMPMGMGMGVGMGMPMTMGQWAPTAGVAGAGVTPWGAGTGIGMMGAGMGQYGMQMAGMPTTYGMATGQPSAMFIMPMTGMGY
jgi:hypothetical protein